MNKKNKNTNNIETKIGIIMRIGVILASLIMLIGFIFLLINNNFSNIEEVNFSNIFTGIIELNPYAIMLLGIFILILTPIIRVISSIILFAKSKDKLYTFITILVLIILCISYLISSFIR